MKPAKPAWPEVRGCRVAWSLGPGGRSRERISKAPHGLALDAQGDPLVQDWNQRGRIGELRRIK